MTKYSNVSGIPLSAAVWLASSHYDYDEKPQKALSATDLNKSVRQYILGQRASTNNSASLIDVSGVIKSKFGSAIHEGIENAWLDPAKRSKALEELGYPKRVIDRIVVNDFSDDPDLLKVFMEIRNEIQINGWTLSGKFDCVFDGTLQDFKSTGTFSHGSGNDWKYISQGSIYRLIHEDLITKDYMEIIQLFTDWSSAKALKDKSYPQTPIVVRKLPLMSIPETRVMIQKFIQDVEKYQHVDEADLPFCEDKHLWRTDPVYKVYKDASAKRAVSGGTFDNMYAAIAFNTSIGGIIKTINSEARACQYCPAKGTCTQHKQMVAIGEAKP